MTITRIVLVAMLIVPGVASAQNPQSSLVLTTKHFAFHSDLATNVNDALAAAVRQTGEAAGAVRIGTREGVPGRLAVGRA